MYYVRWIAFGGLLGQLSYELHHGNSVHAYVAALLVIIILWRNDATRS